VRADHLLRVAAVAGNLPPEAAADGLAPLTHALITRFADNLGVRARIKFYATQRAVQAAIDSREADFGLVRQTPGAALSGFQRTQGIGTRRLVAVVRNQGTIPKHITALSGHLRLSGRIGLADWLHNHYPHLDFNVTGHQTTSDVVAAVANGRLEATLITEAAYKRYRRYFPSLHKAFEIPGLTQRSYWLFASQHTANNAALYDKAVAFIAKQKKSGEYARLKARYQSRGADLSRIGIRAFKKYLDSRLPEWQSDFKKAAHRFGIDWRLLAAISYQESHWRKNAVSSTGVRGLMMLTKSTAKRVGISDRRDPQQSIDGGAQYYLRLKQRLPPAIAPPDRKWFALAAYNGGLSHVLDARRLLERRGEDPNLWVNLKQALLLLTQTRYARHARSGRAPGHQTVAYVTHIQAYYDMLLWHTRNNSSGLLWAFNSGSGVATSSNRRAQSSGSGLIAPIRSPMF